MEIPIIDTYTVVVGIFLPLIISTVIKEGWSTKKKGWISFIFVFAAALGHLFFVGEFDVINLPLTLVKILSLTVVTYKGFWNPTGIINGIETNIGIK
jgi:hypothetical protein